MSASGGTANDLPDALPEFLEATGILAAHAAISGELGEVRRLLTDALRAVPEKPVLRVVG